MNLSIIIIATLLGYAASKDLGNCYEKLEVIQLRWTIQNYNPTGISIYEFMTSPIFPPDENSETQWVFQFSPNGRFSHKDDALHICPLSHFRKSELATDSVSILDNEFYSTGEFEPLDKQGLETPTEHSETQCYSKWNATSKEKLQKYVSKSLDFIIILERLRKLPECIKAPEVDLGRGMTKLQVPPPIKAYHCTTKSESIGDIRYTWDGKVPENPENGFLVTSPVFPEQGSIHQWQSSLEKKKGSDSIALSFTLVSTSTVTSLIHTDFSSVFIQTSPIHRYIGKGDSFTQKIIFLFQYFRSDILSKDNSFKVSFHVDILDYEEICQKVSSLFGSQNFNDGNITTNFGGDTLGRSYAGNRNSAGEPSASESKVSELLSLVEKRCQDESAAKIQELEDLVKIKDEKIKELEKITTL